MKEIEDLVAAKRKGYRSASAFYGDFEGGRWIASLEFPECAKSIAVRKRLKAKWLKEADFTHSFDHSNIVFMRLELVAGDLTDEDLDEILSRPTKGPGGLTAAAKARLRSEYSEPE